jgi:hypothetical protein
MGGENNHMQYKSQKTFSPERKLNDLGPVNNAEMVGTANTNKRQMKDQSL